MTLPGSHSRRMLSPANLVFLPLRAPSPNFPSQASLASFKAMNLKCLGDGRRAGEGQEGALRQWNERKAVNSSVSLPPTCIQGFTKAL